VNYVYLLHQDRGCIDLSLDDDFQMKHDGIAPEEDARVATKFDARATVQCRYNGVLYVI
jgi:hypothetical protein